MTTQIQTSSTAYFRSPGLFVRLGELSVVQGLFVFAALGFILFHPDESGVQDAAQRNTRYWLSDLGQQLADSYAAQQGDTRGTAFDRIETASGDGDSLTSAGLVVVHGDGSLKCIASIDPNGLIVVSGLNPLEAGHFEESLVRMAAVQPAGFALSSIENASQSTFYGTPRTDLADSIVFVALVNHRYVITERASLAYIVFVLFLASTLVSLLTAYLMVKKVQEPLNRLSRGLEETSEGHPCNQDSSGDESELAGLADSANKIALTLREQQDEIRDYDCKLQVAHAELAESQRFLSTLIDSSPSCVLATTALSTI